MNQRIPKVGTYRGIRIHDSQPADRIARVVKPEIDAVHAMADVDELARFAADCGHAPESRLFAAAKVEASWDVSADNRTVRPDVDVDKVWASVAGLDDAYWRDPYFYRSLLDPGQAAKREPPIEDFLTAKDPKQ